MTDDGMQESLGGRARVPHVFQSWDVLVLALDLSRAVRPVRHGLTCLQRIRGNQEALTSIHPGGAPTGIWARLMGPQWNNYIENGYDGFLCLLDNRPIGFVWFHDWRISIPHRHPALARLGIELQVGDVCLFHMEVLPAYRGVPSTAFLSHVCAWMTEAGYSRAYGCVDAENVPARWLYTMLGWQTVARIRNYRLFSVLLYCRRQLFVSNRLPIFPRNSRRPHRFDYRRLCSIGSPGSREREADAVLNDQTREQR